MSPGRSEAGGQTQWFVQKALRGTQTVVWAYPACEEAGGRARDLVPEPRGRRCGRLYSQRLFKSWWKTHQVYLPTASKCEFCGVKYSHLAVQPSPLPGEANQTWAVVLVVKAACGRSCCRRGRRPVQRRTRPVRVGIAAAEEEGC